MFRMRRENMEAFRAERRRDFDQRVTLHLRRCFAARVEALGEAEVQDLIELGVARAQRYGIVTERDVCKLVDLMLVLGRTFDEDHAWARDVLARPFQSPSAKIEEIFERAIRWLEAAPGG